MEIAAYPTDEALMGIAIEEARLATIHGDVPVGALVVVDGRIIARRHNEREASNDPTAHAELLAVRDAARALDSWRLDGATVVCTLEPCCMCAGVLQQARVARVVYGAADLKAGACGSLYSIGSDPRLNHEFITRHGVRAEECAVLLSDFFASRRADTSDSTEHD
ncbi:MAG: tRNA adenosine(34) deaminase TadA [Acidimicrobiaceae bacterium]|nr:tRNA adenosine(34) deaminase TadA [Acidimicrobiaceae bacterium]